jgi:hypothetical protein
MKPRFRVGILIETPLAFATPNCSEKLTKPPAHLYQENPTVTCYFRHLTQVFKKAGIEATPANRQEIDKIIHNLVGVAYKNCPAAWKQVKRHISEDEANFVSMLKDAWEKRE